MDRVLPRDAAIARLTVYDIWVTVLFLQRVVEEGHGAKFRLANELEIPASTLSRKIKVVSEAFDVHLFVREDGGRNADVLSPEGRIFLRDGLRLYKKLESLRTIRLDAPNQLISSDSQLALEEKNRRDKRRCRNRSRMIDRWYTNHSKEV